MQAGSIVGIQGDALDAVFGFGDAEVAALVVLVAVHLPAGVPVAIDEATLFSLEDAGAAAGGFRLEREDDAGASHIEFAVGDLDDDLACQRPVIFLSHVGPA